MLATAIVLARLVAAGADTDPPRPELRYAPPAAPTAAYAAIVDDTTRPRARAIVYSDWYTRRLTIHQWASWTLLPLSVAEYAVGQKLYTEAPGADRSLRDTHKLIAAGIEGLFAVNTVTGAWNLWDARHDPNGRTRRLVHGISMLVADAGFLAASATGPGNRCLRFGTCDPNDVRARTHKELAVASFGLSTASWLMMLVWK